MPPLCKYCGQVVWGEYITALGETWHPEHFLCTGCGRPLEIAQFQVSQGRPYHLACYQAQVAPRCTFCGQPMIGEYVTSDGKSYHPTCYREHIAPRCVYCQKVLSGRYLVDSWGSKFCEEHEKHYPHCSFCSRLIPPQQQVRGWDAGGSQRCAICRSTAIDAAEQAQPLFTQLKQWLGQQGFRFNQLPLRLDLCDRARLEQLLQGRTVVHPLGVTLSSTQWQNGQILSSRVDGVAVLEGMPAMLFAGIVLHELGHVWLTVHRVEHLPPWAEEGFCQLLSHRYYTGLNTPEARSRASSLEADADPVYGEGFRRIHALSERLGFQQFVETLRVTRNLPR